MSRALGWWSLAGILVAFTAYTAWVIATQGYTSVFEAAFSSEPALQIYLDLSISLGLIGIWMIADARRRGLSWWSLLPYVVLTLVLGVIGPLVYLLVWMRKDMAER